jgi:hypothetical protein
LVNSVLFTRSIHSHGWLKEAAIRVYAVTHFYTTHCYKL